MGILREHLYTLCHADSIGVDFKKTLMVGRQNVYIDKKELYSILKDYDPNRHDSLEYIDQIFSDDIPFAEGIFRFFGATIVDSIDYDDYEGATIIHDLNKPIDDYYKNKYSCVYDSGTLEHVFNFPLAIKNCMDMVRIKGGGGHLILETPANNMFGHGFYQFSPELFFSLLNENNGFIDTKIFMKNDFLKYYKVNSPLITKRRHEICCAKYTPAAMSIISKKIRNVPELLSIFESDFENLWEGDVKELHSTYHTQRWKLYEKLPNMLKKYVQMVWAWYQQSFKFRGNFKKDYIHIKDFSKPRKDKPNKQIEN